MLFPVAGFALSDFPLHPSTTIGIAGFAGVYLWRAKQGPSVSDRFPAGVTAETATSVQLDLAAAAAGPSPLQRLSFCTALALLFVTLNGPLRTLSDVYLFSAHTVQSLILTLIVAPLMIAGTPGWMLRPLLRVPLVARLSKTHTGIVACFVWFNLVLAFWHLPPVYNLALAHPPVRVLQHLMFIVAGGLMWWPLMSPLPELPRAAYPAQMLYCFLMVIPMSIISIYIAMADTLLYPAYAAAPRLFELTPMRDQQYGGLIMWVPGGIFFYAVMTVVFFKWSQRGEDTEASAQVGWVAPTNAEAMR